MSNVCKINENVFIESCFPFISFRNTYSYHEKIPFFRMWWELPLWVIMFFRCYCTLYRDTHVELHLTYSIIERGKDTNYKLTSKLLWHTTRRGYRKNMKFSHLNVLNGILMSVYSLNVSTGLEGSVRAVLKLHISYRQKIHRCSKC